MNPLTYLVDYRLTDRSLQITTLGGQFVIREIPYADMTSVKRGYEFWNEHWENRLDLWNSAISIKLDRPMLPWVVITPEYPDTFVADLARRLRT
jgi:hypothetical protein